MQHKAYLLVASFVATMVVSALLVGFAANPAPKPQRVTDLAARLEALEEGSIAQQEMLDDLLERVETLEAMGGGSRAITFDKDVIIPDDWERAFSSDGILRYWHDPRWELSRDEPGTVDLWLDEDTAIFFTWDWSRNLLPDLHDDEEFLRFFEKDLVWSDGSVQMTKENSGPLEFMGEDAHYWEISIENTEGYSSRMLSIFYPCSARSTCNMIFIRYDPDSEDDESLAAFDRKDWNFANTFANGVEFLTEGKATVTGNANLRACPEINCEIVGRLVRGEIVDVVAISEDGAWYRLESGEWVSSALVVDAPSNLPVVDEGEDV